MARSSSRPRAPRRCSAIRQSPFIRTTSVTGTFTASIVRHPFVDRLIPVILDRGAGRSGVRDRRRESHARARPERLRNRESGTDSKRSTSSSFDGTLNENAGPFQGLERFEARQGRGDRALETAASLAASKKHVMTLPRSQRSGTDGRAHDLDAVVREDGATRRACDQGGRRRHDSDSTRPSGPRPTSTGCATSRTGASLASALVGPPDPCLVLR